MGQTFELILGRAKSLASQQAMRFRRRWRTWSGLHFIFDAFVTVMLTWIAQKLASLNWLEVVFVMFLVGGTITSGIAVFLKERERYFKAVSKKPRTPKLPTVIDTLQKTIKSANERKSPYELAEWCEDTRCLLKAMLPGGKEIGDEFIICAPAIVHGVLPFGFTLDGCRTLYCKYLEGLCVRQAELYRQVPNVPVVAHSTDSKSDGKTDRSSPAAS